MTATDSLEQVLTEMCNLRGPCTEELVHEWAKRLAALDLADNERVYYVLHDDGPIRLTETELVNDYMRLRGGSR